MTAEREGTGEKEIAEALKYASTGHGCRKYFTEDPQGIIDILADALRAEREKTAHRCVWFAELNGSRGTASDIRDEFGLRAAIDALEEPR